MASTNFTLTRSIQPYIGLAVILLLVSIFVVATGSFKQNDWTFIFMIVSGSVFFLALNTFIGTRYRVYWRNDAVGMHPVGSNQDVIIPVEKITLVREETSLQRGRAFRRIAIYAHSTEDKATFVDISLKHFVAYDIRKLMRAIHEERPDLALPKSWI
jgi:hypothetical protein